jgi:hypothetical protein
MSIFKQGDKVYNHDHGWGEVRFTFGIGNVEIRVNGGNVYLSVASLSFTEYTLEGFSQVRPKEELPFKEGDVVYVNDTTSKSVLWSTGILKTINKKDYLPFVTSYSFWKYIALENPLLFPDTKIYSKDDL